MYKCAKSIQGFNISYLWVGVSWFSGLSVSSSDVIRLLKACSFSVLLYVHMLRTFEFQKTFFFFPVICHQLKLQMFAWLKLLVLTRKLGFKLSA